MRSGAFRGCRCARCCVVLLILGVIIISAVTGIRAVSRIGTIQEILDVNVLWFLASSKMRSGAFRGCRSARQ